MPQQTIKCRLCGVPYTFYNHYSALLRGSVGVPEVPREGQAEQVSGRQWDADDTFDLVVLCVLVGVPLVGMVVAMSLAAS